MFEYLPQIIYFTFFLQKAKQKNDSFSLKVSFVTSIQNKTIKHTHMSNELRNTETTMTLC